MASPEHRQVEDAVDALRRGRIVTVTRAGKTKLSVRAVDFLTLDQVEPNTQLLLSGPRATSLKITARREAAGADAVLLDIPYNNAENRLAWIIACADPVRDLAFPLKGPFTPLEIPEDAQGVAQAALELARLARLLPALIVVNSSFSDIPHSESHSESRSVEDKTILDYEFNTSLAMRIVTRAQLPLDGAENCEVIAFRSGDGALDHLALVINNPQSGTIPLVRLHSECLTGDLLGSLKCDCGTQLRHAIKRLSKETQGGILLYLAQEGRGVGLINKLRAYALQDQGFDTMEANIRLGFDVDVRDFAPAAHMLLSLGYDRIRLLTNNPGKVEGIEGCGISVEERIPHQFPDNPYNRHYLQTKRDKGGHLID